MDNMKNEEKALLLKDLCARLPYKVKCYCMLWDKDADGCPLNTKHAGIGELCTIYTDEGSSFPVEFVDDLARYGIYDIKPYLRPMSSMTEEEKDHYDSITYTEDETHFKGVWCKTVVDWLNKKMFDYRGLIKKGLALEAPEGMYNTKDE